MANRSDNFNRADGAIGTPSDGGSAWSVLSGTWEVFNNRATESGGGADRACVLEASSSVVDIQATVANVSTSMGLIIRATDNDNYIFLQFNTGTGAQIFKREGGSNTQLAAGGVDAGDNDVVKFAVDASNNFVGYINGVSRVSVTNSFNSSATKHGLRSSNDLSGNRFEDLTITDNAAASGGGPIAGQGRLVGGILINGRMP